VIETTPQVARATKISASDTPPLENDDPVPSLVRQLKEATN
jgi:hypothetical protein